MSYTAAVAYEPARRMSRVVPSLAMSNYLFYQIRVFASVITFLIGVQVFIMSSIFILSSKAISFLGGGGKEQNEETTNIISNDRNISTKNGGSHTAILVLYFRSQFYQQKSGGPDYLAPKLIQQLSLFGSNSSTPASSPAALNLSRVCAKLSRINFHLTGGIFEDQLSFLGTVFRAGVETSMQVRTCFLDDCVETFVRQVGKKSKEDSDSSNKSSENPYVGNVVILGSGFDTRCYRLDLKKRNIRTFEVDAPGTQNEKRRVLREAKIDESDTIFCPCDFETQDWFDCLIGAGLDASLPTMLIWEGVTMYLPKDVVVSTLEKISTEAKRHSSCWYVGFDYLNSDWSMSPFHRGVMSLVGEPFKFGMRIPEAAEFVQSCGLEVVDHLNDGQEMARRYIPEHYSGRPIGSIRNDYGGFMLAAAGAK